MSVTQSYLDSVAQQMHYYKDLGEKAINQVEPEQLFVQINEDTNSIATIVKHLSGNMLSRWTDFLTSDGEKSWRNRDGEFENDFTNRDTVLRTWSEGWICFFNALESIHPDQLTEVITIRGQSLTLIDALNRQLAHYPYHIGQIIYAAKQLKKQSWDSLSIPRKLK